MPKAFVEEVNKELSDDTSKRQNGDKSSSTFGRTTIGNNPVKPRILRIFRLIGKGGFGEVWYGKWKTQEVAVKKPLYVLTPAEMKAAKKELDIFRKLRNRNIIQYYGVHQDEQNFLLVMEYAELGSLADFIINKNVSKPHNWNLNASFIKHMTSGLSYLHHEKVIHRDLKSYNVRNPVGIFAKECKHLSGLV